MGNLRGPSGPERTTIGQSGRERTTIVAVADLHGELTLFQKILAAVDSALGEDYLLVTLGDYVDHGSEIPALLDYLIALKEKRGDRFVPLMGNHDLACARTLGWQGSAPNEDWWKQWGRNFGGGSTGRAYRSSSAKELAERMPKEHQTFLQDLPWYLETEEYVFVHAGLTNEPVARQLESLAHRELPPDPRHTSPQLRGDKATLSNPLWGKTVVSGHHKRPGKRVPGHLNAPHYADPWRITLDSGVEESGSLWAVVLPERRMFVADGAERAHEAGDLE